MNYRKEYENCTGVKLPKNFDVHHIDGDRANNYIFNLVALPKSLHEKCHKLSVYSNNTLPKLLNNLQRGYVAFIQEYLIYYQLCCNWIDYRDYLLGKLPNIHNFSYESN